MRWLRTLLGGARMVDMPEDDREFFERREADLRARHERLERLAAEADVISRTDRQERQPWADR